MVICKEILTDYKEFYEKAIKLVNEESKNDPPTEPYRSHYAARDALLQMKQTLKSSLASLAAAEADNGRDDLTYKIILAFVYRDLGRIYHFTGESSVAEQQLQECIELMEEHRMLPEAIIPYMGALNEMGIVYANRDNHQKAHVTLTRAENAYQEFKQIGAGDAMAITDIFGTADEIEPGKGAAELESLYTQCTISQAEILPHLGQLETSTENCHLTLRRQLALNTFEPFDFALNTATLSQDFIAKNMFKEARHHLAIAQHIMTQQKSKMLTPGLSEQQRTDIIETYKHCHADVARYWAKYGLMLLKTSRDRLNYSDDEKLAADAKVMSLDPVAYRFPDMDVSAIEKRISADYCRKFDDAKRVYHFVMKWLEQAKEYCKPETELTKYAMIIMDFADLYEHVAFFERDPLSQVKMHKRSAKYYEDLLELLNPEFHKIMCRDCWWGCGLAYSSILDIKLTPLTITHSPTVQEAQKINEVCQKAIKNYLEFVNSYTETDGLQLKGALSTEEQCSVLYAYFHLGRLHYKLISADHSVQLENMNNSLKYYKLFADKSVERKEATALLQAQLGDSLEIVNCGFFERDPVNKAKMEKCRADYYEHLLELFHPVLHMAMCRHCWLGCGMEYSTIWKCKYDDALEAGGTPTEQEKQEINEMSQKAIKNFSKFVKSNMESDGLQLISSLSIEEQCNVLNICYLLGDLHYQTINKDLSAKLDNLENSLKYFKLVSDACVERTEATASLQPRLADCRKKLNLLPIEIANVQLRMRT